MKRLVLAAAVAASATLPGAEGVRMEPCGNAEVVTVQAPPGYNAWPMIQAAGERVVCAYSRGAAHNTHEGRRDAYARTSLDGGRTWGPETCIVGTPAVGEAAEGRGTDENGALLFWVGRFGANGGHDLYRTTDGVTFEKIASLPAKSLSPMPIQVMDVFRIPGKGLASPWFAGNYRNPESGHSWGLLVSADNGRTWTQRTVEGDLAKRDWPTELSAVSLGGGRILVLARQRVHLETREDEHRGRARVHAEPPLRSEDGACLELLLSAWCEETQAARRRCVVHLRASRIVAGAGDAGRGRRGAFLRRGKREGDGLRRPSPHRALFRDEKRLRGFRRDCHSRGTQILIRSHGRLQPVPMIPLARRGRI